MFQCAFLFFLQQISVKYHENISAKMSVICTDTSGNTIHFPTGQCSGSPCSCNLWAVAVRDTRFYFAQPNLWPPESSDLNPFDYVLWGVMEQHVYQSSVNTMTELKEHLIVVWSDFREDIIDIELTSEEIVSRHVSMQMLGI